MNKRVNQEKEQEVINEWFESKKDINKYYIHEQ